MQADPRFWPLRRASRGRRIAVFVIGPLLWLGGLVLVALVVKHGEAIGRALLITAASFAVSLAVLVVLRALRGREERLYAARR